MNPRPMHRTFDGEPCTLAQLDPDAALAHLMEYMQGLSCLDGDLPVDRSWSALAMHSHGEPIGFSFDQGELRDRLRPVVEWLVREANANTNTYLVDGETY